MNRHGDGKMIRDTISRLRKAVPDIVIRTTVMVGFPGETTEIDLCIYKGNEI